MIHLSAKVLLAFGLEAAVEAAAGGATSSVGRLSTAAARCWVASTAAAGRRASAAAAIARAGYTLRVPVTNVIVRGCRLA